MLFGCSEKKFDLNEYGFENNNGMTKWIEVTGYDFEKGYAEFSGKNSAQYFLEFKENALISRATISRDNAPSNQMLQSFEKLDNDTALIDEKPILITKRIVDENMLVIVTLKNKKESYFVLEEMIKDVQSTEQSSIYYFE